MTTSFRRFAPFALALAALPGCFDSYRALDTADGGGDAGSLADAQLPDAQLPDAGGSDAGTQCEDGIEWIDPVPELRAMDMGVAPSLVASAGGFELLYLVAGPNPCDGICPWLVRLPTSGAATADLPGYWAYEVGTASYLAARVDENGQPSFAAVVGDELLWVGAPSIASWTIPEGRVTLDGTLGDVVFTADREVIFETHREPTEPGVRHVEGSQVHVVTRTAIPVRTVDTHSLFTMDFWSPRLGLGPDGNVWIGALQNWDFPATVQLANLAGWALPALGSGCGTTTFELAPIAGETTYVIQDCGATSALSRRAGDTVMAAPVTTARQGDVASHVAAAGSRAAVAYRDTSGALTVAVIDGTRGIFFDLSSVLLGTSEVPGSALSPHDATAGPIDLAAHTDGTFAVAWTRTGAEYPEGAVQRFRVCE